MEQTIGKICPQNKFQGLESTLWFRNMVKSNPIELGSGIQNMGGGGGIYRSTPLD